MEGFLSFRIDEIDKLMEICHRIEVLGHLSTDKEGVTQLVELRLTKDGIYLKSRIWRVLMSLKHTKRTRVGCWLAFVVLIP